MLPEWNPAKPYFLIAVFSVYWKWKLFEFNNYKVGSAPWSKLWNSSFYSLVSIILRTPICSTGCIWQTRSGCIVKSLPRPAEMASLQLSYSTSGYYLKIPSLGALSSSPMLGHFCWVETRQCPLPWIFLVEQHPKKRKTNWERICLPSVVCNMRLSTLRSPGGCVGKMDDLIP